VSAPWPPPPEPERCSTGDVETGNCRSCVNYRRARAEDRDRRLGRAR